MPAEAGMFPWRRSYSQNGLDYDYLSGWHKPRKPGWQKRSADKGHVFTRTLYSPDGTKHRVKVYGVQDKETGRMRPTFHDSIWYRADESTNMDELIASAEHAFSGKNTDEVNGVGHIAKLEYAMENDATHTGVMRVTFRDQVTGADSDICLFFNVPPAVYGTLKCHALRKSTSGYYRARGEIRQRHLLGVEFWNLVRVRGYKHNARYPFTYERKAEGKIVKRGNRRIVKITPEIARVIIATNPESDFHIRMKNVLKPNTEVQVVLSDEEFEKYAKELDAIQAEAGEGGGYYRVTGSSAYDENDNAVSMGTAVGQGLDVSGDYIGAESSPKTSFRSKLGEAMYKNLKDKTTELMQSDEVQAGVAMQEALGASERTAIRETLNNLYQNDDTGEYQWLKAVDKNTGKVKHSLYEDTVDKLGRAVLGNNGLRQLYQDVYPAKEGVTYTRVVWTPQMLEDFANPKVPGNISVKDAKKYGALVRARDWQGAFDFLRSHGDTFEYIKKDGKKGYKYLKYINDDDILKV